MFPLFAGYRRFFFLVSARRSMTDRRSAFERRSPLSRRSSSDRVSTPLRRSLPDRRPVLDRLSSFVIAVSPSIPKNKGGC
jgi:hypothetical protein